MVVALGKERETVASTTLFSPPSLCMALNVDLLRKASGIEVVSVILKSYNAKL